MANFHEHLILNRWLLSLFNQRDLHAFKERLGDDRFVGIDEETGQTRFFEQLNNSIFHTDALPVHDLRRYDLHIIAHWRRISARRNRQEGHVLQMKYFQYLSLLFTEIYLDWYFNRHGDLLVALNKTLQRYRQKKESRELQPYIAEDLNRIAFWNATGSGKTLLMHVNILQFRHYCQGKMDKTIILTPNEGLSRQHVEELTLSGLNGVLFDKNKSKSSSVFDIEVIDINKLAESGRDKTVAVEAFAGRNLVLVDEGHRGTSGEAWMQRREALIGSGFAFEYSATFGQAVAKGKTVAKQEEDMRKKKAKWMFGTGSLKKLDDAQQAQLALSTAEKADARQDALFEVYAKAVLFDYSYKFFYADGYGKESLILNMEAADYARHDRLYFTACLLAFYQQIYLFEQGGKLLDEWNLAPPLWIFVGNRVADENSDIFQVLDFLAFFLRERATVLPWLQDLLADRAQIVNKGGNNLFARRFVPLADFIGKEEALYTDILRRLFGNESGGQLTVSLLKKTDGELALSVGNARPFGVINIGKAADFFKTAQGNAAFVCRSDEFGDSLFSSINKRDSKIKVLIGSRKFSEGWSSWRVATMGLLNMGKSEGTQIIQLFGRGVRLKGRGFSLKRSLPHERPKGLHLDKLETLNIFAVNADYMKQFKEYLRGEGITPPDEVLTLDFKVQPNLPAVPLQTLQLKDGYKDNQKLGFKRQEMVPLFEVPKKWQGRIKDIKAELDAYPRVQAMSGTADEAAAARQQREPQKLDSRLFPAFDWEAVYLQLLEYKLARTWSNLRLDKSRLRAFAEGNDWYKLYIPPSELAVHSFAAVQKQQDLLVELLCLYMERFYSRLKAAYEGQFYELATVDTSQGAFSDSYQFEIEPGDDGGVYERRLLELKAIVEAGDLQQAMRWQSPSECIEAICFPPHLFYPLMVLQGDESLPIKMKLLLLNADSEIKFVRDLQKAHEAGQLRDWAGGRDLFLLRNAANKSKGLGFALAGNFYPDFLLWLVDRNDTKRQWLAFVDPKGIRHLGLDNPKFALHEEVKRLERDLSLDISLSGFILSQTPLRDLLNVDANAEALRARHILFMDDEDYLPSLFSLMLEDV